MDFTYRHAEVAGVRWKLLHDSARGQMDNLLQQFEVCFSNPEDYLDVNVELKKGCLNLNEVLFSYCHDKTGRFPTGPLCILHTKGFDNEQIWEQIQLLNEPTVKFAKKKMKEIANMEINPAVTQSMDDGDKPEELLSDNDENDAESESERSDHDFNDHVNSRDLASKQSTQTQDMFFNLAEMNRFLQDEDRKYENRLDSKQDGDNDIDLFREMSSEEDDQLMYNDFFDPPNNRKENINSDREDSEEESDDENAGDEVIDESVEQQLSDDQEMDDTELSSHQKQQQKVINTFHVFCR